MANTDKFIKGARRFSTTIGAGGVADAVATTSPLTTVPSVFQDGDTIEFIVDRVSLTGVKTPSLEETIVGTVSGTNVIDCDRGVEGTAQEHAAGAVVEIKLTADVWNRVIEGILAEHLQSGLHDIVAMIANGFIIDDDTMATASATNLATAESTKAYVDNQTWSNGWIPIAETMTYASATTITVASGAASRYQKGDKLKITQTTVKYLTVIAVADTLLTVTGGADYSVANAAITLPYLSREENPSGFPAYYTFNPNAQGFSGTPTQNGRFSIHRGDIFMKYSISGTSNATTFTFTLPVISLEAAETLASMSFDNGVPGNSPSRVAFGAGSTVATAYKTIDGAGWTNSGSKQLYCNGVNYKF